VDGEGGRAATTPELGPGHALYWYFCVHSLSLAAVKTRGAAGALISCVLILAGCGAGTGPHLRIDGERSFDGMSNPGTLVQAIDRFGYPDRIYSHAAEPMSCYATWREYGITALFQNWGAVGGDRPCMPTRAFRLSSVELRGAWSTDKGLTVGDPVGRLVSIYGITRSERCEDEVGARSTLAYTIDSVPDPLGGPGSRLCTLGAIVSGGKVRGFVMSNRGASE
jgi:hypothetical protein